MVLPGGTHRGDRSHDGGGANKEATRTETVSLKQGPQFVIENAAFVYDDHLISRHQMNCCTHLFVEVLMLNNSKGFGRMFSVYRIKKKTHLTEIFSS